MGLMAVENLHYQQLDALSKQAANLPVTPKIRATALFIVFNITSMIALSAMLLDAERMCVRL
jgi:hypothetical protein